MEKRILNQESSHISCVLGLYCIRLLQCLVKEKIISCFCAHIISFDESIDLSSIMCEIATVDGCCAEWKTNSSFQRIMWWFLWN